MTDYYDAFGGKIGEVEEVWAGDSFNRDTMDCYYSTAGVSKGISTEPTTLSFTVNNCDWNADALASLTGTNTVPFKVVADVDTVTDKFAELQKQIDELRDKIKVESKLRSELRTLRYVREVV